MDDFEEIYKENNQLDPEDFKELEMGRKRKSPPPESFKGIHSEIHLLAKDISIACGEERRFAQYLGIVTRIGKARSYMLLSQLKDPRNNIKFKAKWFMWKSKNN